jgi:DNA replication protein DnaC/transposase
MIDEHGVCQSTPLQAHQGLSASPIATALVLAPRPVASWRAHEHVRPRRPHQRPSTLDPLHQASVRMLANSPSSAAQVCPRLRARGVDGGYSLVKASVRTVRPRRRPALLPVACAPGECAPVEWGAFGSVSVGQTQRRLRGFVMVLGYRRLRSVECTVSHPMAHFGAGQQHAGDVCAGVPQKVLGDQLPSAGLTRALGAAPVRNPTDLDVARDHGVTMVPCPVGQGHEQGRVANGVGYVHKNVRAGLAMLDCSALTPTARPWLDTVAKGRGQGETQDTPGHGWHKARPCLRPLPRQPFDSATVAQVRASRPLRMTLATNRSSVPASEAGHALTRTTSPARRGIYLADTRMARQARRDDRHPDVEDPDHPKPRLEQRKTARDHPLFRRFLARSPRAEADDLTREERRLHPHPHVRTLVALRDIDDPQAVARAMEEALTSEACASESIAHLLAQGARFTPAASAFPRTRSADLLEVRREPPALRRYQATPSPAPHEAEEPDRRSARHNTPASTTPLSAVAPHLTDLQRSFLAAPSAAWAKQAGQQAWSQGDYWARRREGDADVRRDRATKSRLRLARFPVITPVEQVRWDWPTRMHRLQVPHHGHLQVIKDTAPLILLGGVGVGNTHLATALGYAACLPGDSGLFARAIEVINTRAAARRAGRLNPALKQDTKPARLMLDELGSWPLDTAGAARLFHVISLRDAQGAMVITSNRAFKEWPKIFNNDSTLTSALWDRLLRHADTVMIEGKSFRMQDHLEK